MVTVVRFGVMGGLVMVGLVVILEIKPLMVLISTQQPPVPKQTMALLLTGLVILQYQLVQL